MECEPHGTTAPRRGGILVETDGVWINSGWQSSVLALTDGSASNQNFRRTRIGFPTVLSQESLATHDYWVVLYDQTTAIRVYRRLQLTLPESTAKIGPGPN